MSSKAKGRGCWYFVTKSQCPICGRTETFRERRWTKKPKDARKRYEYYTTSGCESHFLVSLGYRLRLRAAADVGDAE